MDRLAVSLEIPELGTGDWIKVRNKKKHTPVQRIDITKMGEKIRERVANVAIDDELLEYAEEMIEKTREHEAVDKEQTFLHGYRPFDQLLRFASASAVMGGYESLSGSDIQAMGRFVLAHRTVIDIEAQEQADSYTFDRVYEEVLKELPDVSDDE
jgi:MoxR-like ATPase